MNGQRNATLVILALLVLVPLAAAAGTITGLTANPSPATKNSPVTITVQGTGACKALQLSFGDGTGTALEAESFPKTIQHTYAQTGTFSIQAQGLTKCDGVASVRLTVGQRSPTTGSLAELCKKVDCGGMVAHIGPKIDKVFSIITPGGAALVGGSGFGSMPGKLLLRASSGAVFELTNLEWYATGVGGKIPSTITGLKDLNATLQIVTKNGSPSNEWPVQFVAELKSLSPGDIQGSCSDEADSDNCTPGGLHEDFIPFCIGPWPFKGLAGASFSGYHWTCVGSSYGTDSFSASIKNGWRFDSAVLEDLSGSPSVIMSGFQKDTTSMNVSLKWNNAGVSYVWYRVYVYVIGPSGVPHK
jgi:hypothetical protein